MIQELKENGYVIIPSFFKEEELFELQVAMTDIAHTIHCREFATDTPKEYTLKFLDFLIKDLFNKDKALIGEVYDAFAYCIPFLRLISSNKMEFLVSHSLNKKTTLYGFTNRCRIDPPHDTRRTYGWHQEVFYTIPKGRFIQTWAPLFRDTTIVNGTIEIAERSNRGILKQSWTEEDGKATQIIVDPEEISKCEKKPVEMKVGDLLIFTGETAHRSGYNSSNDVRYSLVGMYHDCSNKEPYFPKPDFKFRGISPMEWYDSVFPFRKDKA